MRYKKTFVYCLLITLFISQLIIVVFPLGDTALGEGDYPPPSQGDWIISTDTYVKGETITVERNITVESGGKLTLDNVTLMINTTNYGDARIKVKNGSELNIINNSMIKEGETKVNYDFEFENGSRGLISNSTIRDCGWNDGGAGQSSGGILIRSDDVVIENSTIQHGHSGIVIIASSPSIKNNEIKHNQNYGINIRLGAPIIQGNTIFNNPVGILAIYVELTLLDNVIRDNGDGAKFIYSSVTMKGDKVLSNAREDCTTGSCSSQERGLGIYAEYAYLTTNDVNISDNNDDGILAYKVGLEIQNSFFSDNFGNGIAGYYSEINLSDNLFSNNSGYGIEWSSSIFELNESNSFVNNNGEGRGLMMWDVNINVVDEYSDDVSNAKVKLKGKSGDHVNEYIQNTNYLGSVDVSIAEIEILNDGTYIDYNPYTLTVEKTGSWDDVKYSNTTSEEIREDTFIDIILPLKKPDLKVESLSFSETPRSGTEVKIKVKIANIGEAKANEVHFKLTWKDANGIPHILNTTIISIDSAEVTELSIPWAPEDSGRVTINAEITTSYDEIEKGNNELEKHVDVEGENPYLLAGLISLLVLIAGLVIYILIPRKNKEEE